MSTYNLCTERFVLSIPPRLGSYLPPQVLGHRGDAAAADVPGRGVRYALRRRAALCVLDVVAGGQIADAAKFVSVH
jgi:hypothetical protein